MKFQRIKFTRTSDIHFLPFLHYEGFNIKKDIQGTIHDVRMRTWAAGFLKWKISWVFWKSFDTGVKHVSIFDESYFTRMIVEAWNKQSVPTRSTEQQGAK